MATVRLVERDAKGLVTRVIEVDESEPLVGRVNALEQECDELRTRLGESEQRRATEGNRLSGELREAQAAHEQANEQGHAATCDFIDGLLRESQRAGAEVRRLREALAVETNRVAAEASRARVLERALIQAQNEVRRLREELDEAEAHIEAVARRNRQNRPKKLDANERAIEAYVKSLNR